MTREIVYRLLTGEQGSGVRQMGTLGGESNRVPQATAWLRREYDRPLGIDEPARGTGMSMSSFHHHFMVVTNMSPLQFQTQLRLQVARRLMLGDGYDGTTAGLRVGYDDASHVSREYKRLFGEPPMRDVARLRATVLDPARL